MIEIEADYDGEPFTFESFSLNEKNKPEIQKLFNVIVKVWNEKKENYTLRCKSIVYEILAKASLHQEKVYTPKSMASILEPAEQYISTHLSDPNISNKHLASLCSISVVYFRKLFERTHGVSPIKYLKTLHIKKAKSAFLRPITSTAFVIPINTKKNAFAYFAK